MKNAFPISKSKQLFEDIAEIKQSLAVKNMISEKEAAELLSINVSSLQVYVSKGRVPEDCFTISPVTKERFYYRDKLIGLK